jgi:hypothetical protein
MPPPEFGQYPGQPMAPELSNRAAFARNMHQVIVHNVLGGTQIFQARIAGVMRFFRLPAPEQIMDFVSIRDVGQRGHGGILAQVHVLIPEVATTDVDEEEAGGTYFYRSFTHLFSGK